MNIKTLLFVLPVVAACLLSSCKKESEIDDQDVIDNIETSLKSGNGGAVSGMDEMTDLSAPYKSNNRCGEVGDTTVQRAAGNWSRTANWHWVVNCDMDDVYENVTFTESGNSSYTGTRLEWAATHAGTIVVTNLAVSEANYLFNGTMNRVAEGTITSRRRSRDYNTNISHTWTNVAVDKSDKHIVSGTGSFTFSGAVTNGNSFSRTGTVLYNGDGTATVTLDNGNVFTINVR